MKIAGFDQNGGFGLTFCPKWRIWPSTVVFLGLVPGILVAQNADQESLSQQIQKLTQAMASTQAQLEQSQRQLNEMQKQLKALQQQVAQSSSTAVAPAAPGSASSTSTTEIQPTDTDSALQDLRDRQAMQESQIATLEQTKIES